MSNVTSTKTLLVRSHLPATHPEALPAELTLGELASLRASSKTGIDRTIQSAVLDRTQFFIDALLAQITAHSEIQPSDIWIESRPYNPDYDGYFKTAEVISNEVIGEFRRDDCTYEQRMMTVEHQSFTKAQVIQLYKVDPENWSDEALKWAGIERAAQPAQAVTCPIIGGTNILVTKAVVTLLEEEGFIGLKSLLSHSGDRNQWVEGAKGSKGRWDTDRLRWFLIKYKWACTAPKVTTRPKLQAVPALKTATG